MMYGLSLLAYQLVNPISLQTFQTFFLKDCQTSTMLEVSLLLHCFKSVNHNLDPLICFLRQSVPFTELVKITEKIGEK